MLSSCKNYSILYVFDKGIHKRRLLLAKINSLICDVIPDSHLIGERRNNVQDYYSTGTDISIKMKIIVLFS